MANQHINRNVQATAPGRARAASAAACPRWLALIAVLLLAIAVSNCGSNATTIGVTVIPSFSSTSALPVIEDQTQTFSANVTGGSTTTVYWQICLPPTKNTSPPTEPTTCTPIPGVTVPGQTALSGYGLITQNGVYTAPASLPQTNPFVIMAISTVNFTAFGTSYVRIDSGIRVLMEPTTASLGTGQTYAFTANVIGTTNTAVTWDVGGVAGGNTTVGTIVAGGPMCPAPAPDFTQNCATYTAPAATTSTSVTATSSADASQSATANVSVADAADPVLTSVDPTILEQGSVQQDIYLTGTNLFSTSTVLVNGTPVSSMLTPGGLLRATIPSNLLARATTGLPIQVERQPLAGQQTGDLSAAVSLPVVAVRPVVVASSPDSVQATPSGFGVSLTGGFLSQTATSTTFNGFPGTGTGTGVTETFTSSRQMIANIPAGALSTPGLYPLVVQNSAIAATGSSTSATNIAVTPPAGSLLSSPAATITGLGSSPSAIAIDQADGLAVVANTGSNTASIISLATNSVIQTVSVGNAPTGVAVDDALLTPLDHIAVVVNSGDNTVSTIDLKTFAVSAPLTLPKLPAPQLNEPAPEAYSIGINPATHRAIVAITSTNVATILDLSSGEAVVLTPQVGGSNTSYGTGPQPNITVDPRLNWAVVTWGGGGLANGNIVSLVDLGRTASGSDPGRDPAVAATLSLGTSNVLGVGINTETRQVLITTPNLGNFTTFSLLDQSVGTIPFTYQGATVDEPGYVAAAASPLSNVGVAVNTNANRAAILDLQNRLVIGEVTIGKGPVAVAIDPNTNQALVANQTDGTISVLSLGLTRSSASLGSAQAPQITLSAPEIAYTSANPLTLIVEGAGFAPGAQVFLDGTAVPSVVSTGGQIIATVPAAMLGLPRRYSVYVQNPGQTVISNVEDLTVIQAVSVGSQPYGVAIDTECDVAAVTNSADSTVSVVALTPNPITPGKTCPSNGAIGTVGAPISVGTTPQGIAIDSHLDLAVVANSGSIDASVVDLTETNPPSNMALCGGSCTSVNAVAINPDTSGAYVTGVQAASNVCNVSGITLPDTRIPASATSGAGASNLDLTPDGIAVDQYLGILGVAATGTGLASTNPSAIDLYNVQLATNSRASGFELPTGILFDPVNQVFVVTNSLPNQVGFVDPASAISTFVQVGMNPTALDYNYQTSTLVTANNASNTMSIISYVCPPGLSTSCSAPAQVRGILPIGGSPQFSIAIDPKLNLAVLTDEKNNRVLLIPLP